MKKLIFLLFVLVGMGSTLHTVRAEAVSQEDKSELTINFLKDESSVLAPPATQNSLPNTNTEILGDTIKPKGKLPSTGDLITSVIWTCTGTFVLIILIGLVSLKKYYTKFHMRAGEISD